MIPYSKPKLSDLYTLFQSKLLENHNLHSGTYLYSPYLAVSPGRTCNLKMADIIPSQATVIRATKTFSLFCNIAAKRVKTQSCAFDNMFDSNLSQQIKLFGKRLECWLLIGHNYAGVTLCTGGTSPTIENVCLGPVNAQYVQILMQKNGLLSTFCNIFS